jgi:hypothetical protein
MNTIKRISMATILAVLLTTTTFAGTIHTGAVDPPPPPPDRSTATATTEPQSEPGEISTGLVPSDLGTEIVLNLLQLLTVF